MCGIHDGVVARAQQIIQCQQARQPLSPSPGVVSALHSRAFARWLLQLWDLNLQPVGEDGVAGDEGVSVHGAAVQISGPGRAGSAAGHVGGGAAVADGRAGQQHGVGGPRGHEEHEGEGRECAALAGDGGEGSRDRREEHGLERGPHQPANDAMAFLLDVAQQLAGLHVQ